MPPSSISARTLGALFLLQLAGLIAPFAMVLPMVPAEYLGSAAAHAGQVRLAVALLVANSALTVALSFFLRRILGPEHEGISLLLVVTSGILFALQSVDNAHLLAMLGLSERFQEAGAARDLLGTAGEVLRSTRRWVHYATLFTIEAWMFTLYTALFRSRIVPRGLALFGVATVLAHFGGTVLPFYLGRSGVTPLAMLMGVSELGLAGWLGTRGYAETRTPAAGG
jgi:hypothetical protein